MADLDPTTETMRAVLFRAYGDPAAVLSLETVPVPTPGVAGSASSSGLLG